MAKLDWFPFFVKEFLQGTSHMSSAEVGVYLRLLLHSWEIGPLPTDEARLARLANEPLAAFRRLWPTVEKKWQPGLLGLTNEKLEGVRAQQLKSYTGAVRRGEAGAAARWGRDASSIGPSNRASTAVANETSMPDASTEQSSSSAQVMAVKKRDPDPPVPTDQEQGGARARLPQSRHRRALTFPHQLCPEGTWAACARGICLPGELYREWLTQYGDDHGAGQTAIVAMVEKTLAALPAGPIGEQPFAFWRRAWEAFHGRPDRRAPSVSATPTEAGKYAAVAEPSED